MNEYRNLEFARERFSSSARSGFAFAVAERAYWREQGGKDVYSRSHALGVESLFEHNPEIMRDKYILKRHKIDLVECE
jgi:hypothetical protein